MDPRDHKHIRQLQGVTFLPGSWDKRFAYNLSALAPEAELTEKQIKCLRYMAHRYRRQIRGHTCDEWCVKPWKRYDKPAPDEQPSQSDPDKVDDRQQLSLFQEEIKS